MSNRVFINKDGFIEQTYDSHQTREKLSRTVEESIRLITKLQEERRPVLVLVDITNLGKLATPSRKSAVNALKDIAYDKIAVYGSSTFTKALVNLIVHASGKHGVIHIFDERKRQKNG